MNRCKKKKANKNIVELISPIMDIISQLHLIWNIFFEKKCATSAVYVDTGKQFSGNQMVLVALTCKKEA